MNDSRLSPFAQPFGFANPDHANFGLTASIFSGPEFFAGFNTGRGNTFQLLFPSYRY